MRALFFVSFLFYINITFAVGDPVAGEAIAVDCKQCHGMDGMSRSSNYPNLAGQREFYLLKQLRNFKNGRRQSPIMKSMISDLEEQDLKDVAAYYSGINRCE